MGESKRSGLILCKPNHAEFVGPGSAICNPGEVRYTRIIAIGSPDLVEMTTYEQRQQAYSRRIQWVRWLHRIVSEPDGLQRAEKLFYGFEEFFGSDILAGIPNDVLALLAGVLPQTIVTLRSHHQTIERGDGNHCALCVDHLDVKVITLETVLGLIDHFQPTPPLRPPVCNTLNLLPFSA